MTIVGILKNILLSDSAFILLADGLVTKSEDSNYVAIHLQSIHLPQLLSYSFEIADFDLEAVGEMKQEGLSLFRWCCVFDAKISPSLWNYIMFNDFMLENI